MVHRLRVHQPFEEAPVLTGRDRVVDGRADEDRIRCLDFFEDPQEIVFYGTVPVALAPDPLAGKAAGAALVV